MCCRDTNSRPRQNESRTYGIARSTRALSRGRPALAGSISVPVAGPICSTAAMCKNIHDRMEHFEVEVTFPDFYAQTAQLLTEIRVPKRSGWGAHYEKFVRVAHQWPIVAVAAAVKVDGGTISEARVGLTNMGSTPLRARAVEEALVGQQATEDAVRTAAAAAAEGTHPPSDLNGDADYRKHLATVLTRRAVLAAAGG